MYSQPQDATTVDYEVFILPGEPMDDFVIQENVFRVDSIVITGDADEYALVTFTNTHSEPATEADIYVLAFDPDGVIIGGAKSLIKDGIPVGSPVETEIYVYYNRDYTVAEVKAWVIPYLWTKFE